MGIPPAWAFSCKVPLEIAKVPAGISNEHREHCKRCKHHEYYEHHEHYERAREDGKRVRLEKSTTLVRRERKKPRISVVSLLSEFEGANANDR